ncbi:MAG: hypothetical protein IKF44_00440 [Mycoplasmataceae bacterium]|nr:hypothetical protein [Mycoplasmataceae bacterium]
MSNKNNYEPGTIFLCKVLSISKNFFEVITSNKIKGIVFINETSDYYVKNLNNIISVGSILYLTLKEIKKDMFIFSFKESRTSFLKTPFNFQLTNLEASKKDFENLLKFTNKEIKKWKKLK